MKNNIIVLFILMNLFLTAQNGIFEIYDLGVLGSDVGWAIETDEAGYTIGTGSICDPPGCFKIIRADQEGNELWTTKIDIPLPFDLRLAPRCLIKTGDGNILVGGDRTLENGDNEVFLMKIEIITGDTIWMKYYNSYATDFVRSIIELPDGDILVNTDGDTLGTNRPNKSIIKTDNEGNIIWHKDYFDEFRFSQRGNMVVLSTGELLMCYEAYKWGWDYPFTTLTKLDSEGNMLWTNAYYYGFTGSSANRVVETSEGNYMLFGEKDTVQLAWVSLLINIIDTSGQIISEKYLYLGDYDTYIYQVVNSNDGNVLVCGDYSHPAVEYDKVGWIVKLDPQGNKLWEKYITNEGHMYNEIFTMSDIKQNPYGNIALSMFIRDMKPNGQYDLDGNAALLVLDSMGCFEPGCGEYQEIPTTLSGIKTQPIASAPIAVFPNPASTELRLRWREPDVGSLKLYNAFGKIVADHSVDIPDQEFVFGIDHLPAGMYILSWESKKHAIFSQKIIITK
jgi:hypothetical protein